MSNHTEDLDLARKRAHIKMHLDRGDKTCEWYLPEEGTDSVEELARKWGLGATSLLEGDEEELMELYYKKIKPRYADLSRKLADL